MNLDQLIVKFQDKNTTAFEELYIMYGDSIFGVINNIVHNEDISKEILQDVFIKAWNKADTYSSKKGRFFTWLLNIARNAAIDKVRSKEFKKTKQNLNSQFFVDILETNDNLDRLTNAIGIKEYVKKLAETCKNIIELLYFKGYTQKEASETLKMPIGTIKTRNRNCINELRKMLDL